jgi:gliding motility-associated-like protein
LKQRATFFILCLFTAVVSFAQSMSANFKSDITAGCSPIVVNFQDASTGNPAVYKWDFGNGATSSKQNPSTTYFSTGTYTVTLTVSNAEGTISNTITKTAYITVYDLPTAEFSSNKQEGCSPHIIEFKDNSTSPPGTRIVNWKWDFGDGGSSTEKNPKYIYRNAGSYTVTLTISTDKGCSKLITKPNYITISEGVKPRFQFVDPGVCSAPATINFTNTSTGPSTGTLTYKWDLGNGSTATSIHSGTTYVKNGTYTISLVVTSSEGCADSTRQTISVGKATTDFTAPNEICPKTSVSFLNNSSPRPIKSHWEFSNGHTDNLRNATTSFSTPGTYTVKLVNTYTVCTDTLVRNITVIPGPTIDFTAKDTGRCGPPFNVNFNNKSTATSYKWDFGDGTTSTDANPSHTYTKYGEFDVTLIATNSQGCTDTLRKPKYIKIIKPIITFPTLPTKGCIPYPFNFAADIVMADDVKSYRWDFGDGGSSTEATPAYTYNRQGTYTVTLTITTSTGCTETFTLPQAVKVGTKPVANFTYDKSDVCASDRVQFTNLSPKPTDEWNWFFSDGSISTDENPLHSFIDTGKVDVKLVVYNNGCPSDTMIREKLIFVKPSVSKFIYKPDCDDKLVYEFFDRSIAATSWEWKIDGVVFHQGSNKPPKYKFPGYGTYNVSLTTTNGSCEHTLTRTITIADYRPDFTADIREGCKDLTVTFTGSSPNPGYIKSYVWDFGNGALTADNQLNTTQFTFTEAGNYNIRLITIDTFDCRYETPKNDYIRVNGPNASFISNSSSGCKGLTTTFTDATKTDGVNPIVKWEWDFGDGTKKTFTSPPFQHTYDSIGDYDVSLRVTDAKGCTSDTLKRGFVIISILKADWSSGTASCPGAPIGFSNQTRSDLPYTTLWTFGDGQTSTAQNTSNTYTDTGFYSVKLKVRDIFGCEDSLTKTNVVQISYPVASFTANNFSSFCTPFEAKFQNTSTFYQSSEWDLGNGKSGATNPTTYYTASGDFPIRLIVTSPGGCTDTAYNNMSIYNPQDATFNYSPIDGCIPLTIDLEAFTKMNGSFVWDLGDGNVIDTNANVLKHKYVDFGNFVPKVILREPSGVCVVPLTGDKTITLRGVKAKYALDKNFFCDSGTIKIADSTTFNDPIINYTWDMGDGTIYNTASPGVHQYNSPGLYTVTFHATTQTGCTDTLRRGPIKIVQSPDISVRTDSIICVNDRLLHTGILERTDTSAIRWQWFFPNGNTSQLQIPVPQQYVKAGTYQMKTYAYNSSGCADSVSQTIFINPLPNAVLPSTITMQAGFPVTLPATFDPDVINYSWAPAATLSCATCPQPIASPKFNTRYTVTYTDSNGCRNNSVVQVIVLCKNANVFVPNTFSPNGDGANDVFYVRGKGLDRVKSIRVFNRWGEVVFEQRDFPVNDPTYGWNGKYKGNRPSPDVYVYQVEVFCDNSEIIRFEGNIALIL